MIELRNVSKRFLDHQNAIVVLQSLNLAVAERESVSIVGESGSGKTTLLSLLAGLERADGGDIHAFGENLTAMSEDGLAQFRLRKLGIVFQQFHLVPHLTALENVALPLEIAGKTPNDAKHAAQEILAKVKLQARLKHFPRELSGGECQRVALARALVSRPKLVLADEPTGNLDAKTGGLVMDMMFDLAEQAHITLILVTHSLELARRCQRSFELRDGQLKEGLP